MFYITLYYQQIERYPTVHMYMYNHTYNITYTGSWSKRLLYCIVYLMYVYYVYIIIIIIISSIRSNNNNSITVIIYIYIYIYHWSWSQRKLSGGPSSPSPAADTSGIRDATLVIKVITLTPIIMLYVNVDSYTINNSSKLHNMNDNSTDNHNNTNNNDNNNNHNNVSVVNKENKQ